VGADVGVVVGVGVALAACAVVSTSGPVPDASPDTAQAMIGAAGGTLSTPDGVLTLTIPRGAVDHDVLFTVGPTAPPLSGAVGSAFEIGPSGTKLATPATIAIRYTSDELADGSAADLLVATVAEGRWQPLLSGALDTGAMVASGTTGHLSPYALVHAALLVSPEAGSCAADDSAVASCAAPVHPLCSSAPGTVLVSCSNNSGGGYTASCCPAPEAGVPMDAESPAEVGVADALGDARYDATEAASACTSEEMTIGACATPAQPLCSDLSGSVVVSCTDNPAGSGFIAVCCPLLADAGDGG
jgi:hypothetical protein